MSASSDVTDRIKARFGPEIAATLSRLLNTARSSVDMARLEALLGSGASVNIIVRSLLSTSDLARIVGRDPELLEQITAVTRTAGQASMTVVEEALGVALGFDYTDPLAVEAARTQIGALVREISVEQLRAIRNAIELGQAAGLTITQQANLIREAVGLPSNMAGAPANFADELRNGLSSALTRRLPERLRREIERRFRDGTITEAFIAEAQATYSRSLIDLRARTISRTETSRATHEGQERAWQTAMDEGLLPPTARRYWIITPDERLRRSHAEIVVMNPEGVEIGEPFETPFGEVMYPPAEPNCRCSVGLLMEGGSVL